MNWNATLYDNKLDFVSNYGESLLELLDAQAGERILDVGCGTGDLAYMMAEKGAQVLGIDASPEMIARAKAKYADSADFKVLDAALLDGKETFDAVFSNAALHWMLEKEKVVRGICSSLRKGGRFVFEMGGTGNVKSITDALHQALKEHGKEHRTSDQHWYFPSLSEYATLLESNGFRVAYALHFNRKTPLKGENGMATWLEMFAEPFFKNMKSDEIQVIVRRVEEMLRPSNFENGVWFADYVRLRMLAYKN
jgi:trans-aconitate methyltransferase